MRKIIPALLVAAPFIATPAFAQDGTIPFNGPRVEALIGYDHLGAGSDVDNDNGRDDQKIDGVTYGVGIGYDVNFGSFVAGVEGEITDSSAKSNYGPYSETFGFGRVNAGRDLYVGARAGILATPATLVYVKGGYTNQKLGIRAGNLDEETDASFKLDGWRIGGGVEHQFTSNVYGKLEYRYSNYTDAHIDYVDGAQSARFGIDTDRHQVVAGVGYRF